MLRINVMKNDNGIKLRVPLCATYEPSPFQEQEVSTTALSYWKSKKINPITNFEKERLFPTVESHSLNKFKWPLFSYLYFIRDGYEWTTGMTSDLGFDSSDFINQTQRLQSTSLTLSLFDSTDSMSQSLLGYETLYLDYKGLSDQYSAFLSSGYTNPEQMIPVNFIAFNPSKYKNKPCEGFYQYIYKDLIKDTGVTYNAYLKAELFNSCNGKTIQLMASQKIRENLSNLKRKLTINDFNTYHYMPVKIGYSTDMKEFYYKLFDDYNYLYEAKID